MSSPFGRRALRAALSLLSLVIARDARAGAPPVTFEMEVWRVAGDRVDVAVPTNQGAPVGSRLVVERGGAEIALLEVISVSRLSVGCRVERELGEIRLGDSVRALESTPPVAVPAAAEGAIPEAVAPVVAGAEAAITISVRQVMGDTVFLDAGRSAGLVPGQRAQVLREGAVVAQIEIEFVSTGSASCKRLDAGAPLAVGDLVVPAAPPRTADTAVERESPSAKAERVPAAGGSRSPSRPQAPRKEPWADLGGSVALRFQGFQDGTTDGRDILQSAAVVNLNLRDLGGSPLTARVRMRVGQDQITRPNRPMESERNDRFYELALAYAPAGGELSWQVGRLTAGPEVGFDYLDGLLGEYRVLPTLGVGGFIGNRSDVEDLSYDASGRAYGAFLHHLSESPDRPFYSESFVSLIGEYREGETNREFVSFYGRQGSGSRWSLYERAELDLNRDWRGDTGADAYQLSNFLLAGTYTVSKSVRLGLTYDERRQYRTLDDRNTPEQLFDDALREGLRVNVYLGSGRGLRANLSAGLRRREGSSEQNLTYNGSFYHGNVLGWDLLVGVDYAGFSGETSEGYRGGVRVQKYFSNGYDLELTVGRSLTTLLLLGEERNSQWMRLSGTAQMGRHFFLIGEYEDTTGDDLAGRRLFLQLGYRF